MMRIKIVDNRYNDIEGLFIEINLRKSTLRHIHTTFLIKGDVF